MITPVLDHVVLDVHEDMAAAEQLYRRLGFTLTPRGHHTLGSINHLAMFRTDYLELLGWPAGETSGRPELADHPRGLNGLVFKTDDADATFAHLDALGLATAPPRAFSRPVQLGGETRDAKFRTVHVPAEKSRIGRIYFCQHLTPELVWRPEWQAHANGVTTIKGLVIEAQAAEPVAELFRAMFGDAHLTRRDGQITLAAGTPRIEIVGAPDASRDRMAVLRLGRPGTGEVIPAGQAGGVQLEFVPE
jgi:hypothetical protein